MTKAKKRMIVIPDYSRACERMERAMQRADRTMRAANALQGVVDSMPEIVIVDALTGKPVDARPAHKPQGNADAREPVKPPPPRARKLLPFKDCKCGELTAILDPTNGLTIRRVDTGGKGTTLQWGGLGLRFGESFDNGGWSPALKWLCRMAEHGRLETDYDSQTPDAAKAAAHRFNKAFVRLTGTTDNPLSKDGPLIRCRFGSIRLPRNER